MKLTRRKTKEIPLRINTNTTKKNNLYIGAWNFCRLMGSAVSDRPRHRTALGWTGRYKIEITDQIGAANVIRSAEVGEIKKRF